MDRLKGAAENLFAKRNLSDFTSVAGETEWNLAPHLANEIYQLFPQRDRCFLLTMMLGSNINHITSPTRRIILLSYRTSQSASINVLTSRCAL